VAFTKSSKSDLLTVPGKVDIVGLFTTLTVSSTFFVQEVNNKNNEIENSIQVFM
jgi:hypothetical protein